LASLIKEQTSLSPVKSKKQRVLVWFSERMKEETINKRNNLKADKRI
jgi:hypothetical protein